MSLARPIDGPFQDQIQITREDCLPRCRRCKLPWISPQEPKVMLDHTEALKHIRTLATVGITSDTPELMIKHFEEIKEFVKKALSQNQRPSPPSAESA